MLFLFPTIAFIATLVNWTLVITKKPFHWAMGIALAFTALTVCAQLQMIVEWIVAEDWTALLDVAPTMTNVLWGASIVSIVVNMAPLRYVKSKKRVYEK